MDAFLLKYDIHVINFSNSNYADFYTTSPNFPLNMKALADSFALLPCVTWSISTMTQFFHVNEIQYERDQSGSTLYFWLKWGDCMAGCTSAKIYAYQLDNACNVVNFLDTVFSALDPYPGLINCFLSPLQTSSPIVNDQLKVYPNPSSNLLHIERPSPSEEYAYSLCSAVGVPILSGNLPESGTVDISSLSGGIYYLLLREKNGRLLKKSIVKY